MPDENDVLNQINANPSQGYQKPNGDSHEHQSTSAAKQAWEFVWETAKLVIICLAIIIPIRYYLVQPFFVKGASMENNFHDGDYLLIDEISYRFNEPHRGDVIVFRFPENPSQFYIKRIIGLPGETVEVKNDQVKIFNSEHKTGFVLDEYYLSEEQQTLGNTTEILAEDEYFVMGDNRLQSSDSRRWGHLPKKLITGRAFLRLWPMNRITKIDSVNY